MIELILLGTSGCHLCEDAEIIINNLDLKQVVIKQIDIAEEEQWQEKYAVKIPVLFYAKTGKELDWPFDEIQVQRFMRELND